MKRLLTSLVLILLFAAPSFAFDIGDCGIKDIPVMYKNMPVHLLVCSDASQVCTQAFVYGRRGPEFMPGLDCNEVTQRVDPPHSHHDFYPCWPYGICKR
jgi:hypothetical protein